MTWRWLDVVGERPADAEGAVPLQNRDRSPAGFLAWWPSSTRDPRPGRALRVDERIVAGGGRAAWISWCRFDEARLSLRFRLQCGFLAVFPSQVIPIS